MRIEYICGICERRFNNESDCLKHEEDHLSYTSETTLEISHQPYKKQATFKFKFPTEFYDIMIENWNKTGREYDFEQYFLKQFDDLYFNDVTVLKDKNKLELDQDECHLISVVFAKREEWELELD